MNLVSLLTVLALGALAPGVPRIILRDQVLVAEDAVRLSEIAQLEPAVSPPLPGRLPLADLIVARGLSPGTPRTLRAGELAARLAQAGWRTGEYELAGALEVRVTRETNLLALERLKQLLDEALGVRVRLITGPSTIALPQGALSLALANPPRELPAVPTALTVHLFVSGVRRATHTVIVAREEPGPTTGPGRVAPALPSSPLLRRGERVDVVSRVGRIEIRAPGKTLGTGRLGESILVAVEWSRTPLKGVISGEKEVRIP